MENRFKGECYYVKCMMTHLFASVPEELLGCHYKSVKS